MSAGEERSLLPHQLAALRALAVDPAAWIESATLNLLRRRKFVGKVVEKARPSNGMRQKTTSPLTAAGWVELRELPPLGTPFQYDGPAFSKGEAVLKPGAIGRVTEVLAERTESNPLGCAVITYPCGLTRVFRPHMSGGGGV